MHTNPVSRSHGFVWARLALGLTLFLGALWPGAHAQTFTQQLDMSAAFNRDVVWRPSSAALTDPAPDPASLCAFDVAGRCYVSSALAVANASPASAGLPDNGFIASDGVNFPDIQLAPFNTAGNNAWVVTDTTPLPLNLATPGRYSFAHFFVSSGGVNPGTPASFQVRLRYGDGEEVLSPVLIAPDWFGENTSDSYYVLNHLDRTDLNSSPPPPFRYDAASQSGVADAAVFGLRIPVNNEKVLVGLDIIPISTPGNVGVFTIFGAMVTRFGGPALSDDVAAIPTLSELAMLALAALMLWVLWRERTLS